MSSKIGRRDVLKGSLALIMISGPGCISPDESDSAATGSPNANDTPLTPDDTATPTPADTETATPTIPDKNLDEPYYGQELSIENNDGESHEVEITITHRSSGETVYQEVSYLDPGDEKVLYDFNEAPTDGVESYRITANILANGEHEGILKTSECYLSPWVEIMPDGGIFVNILAC